MTRKSKVQAMPGRSAAGVSKDVQINPGKAGPRGALGLRSADKAPSSGPPGAEGNNTRRDFVGGTRKLGRSKRR